MRPAFPSICFLVVLVLAGCDRTHVSLSSTSPNGSNQVEIVELKRFADRNFVLRLHRGGTQTNMFYSPDEGPAGTERILWSKDSAWMLLIGRNFVVEEQAKLPDGQQLYLLCDINSGDMRCNASQSQHRRFAITDVAAFSWEGSIERGVGANGNQPSGSGTNQMP